MNGVRGAIASANQVQLRVETKALAFGHQVRDLGDLSARVVREVEVTARMQLVRTMSRISTNPADLVTFRDKLCSWSHKKYLH